MPAKPEQLRVLAQVPGEFWRNSCPIMSGINIFEAARGVLGVVYMPTIVTLQEITKPDFHLLTQVRQPAVLTLLVPNAGGAQAALGHGAAALKDLLRSGRELLSARGLEAEAINHFLAPVTAFLANPEIWGGTEQSLFLFRTPDAFYSFAAPLAVEPRAIVGSHFYLKPLFPFLAEPRRYYVLAISENSTRLLRCENSQCTEVHSGDLPSSLKEALHGRDFSTSLQAHFSGASGGPGLTHHAHSGPVEEAHQNRQLYCRHIQAAIRKLLGVSGDPLILACVKEYIPLFQRVNTYANLSFEAILGNPDHLTPSELHAAAQKIANLQGQQKAKAALARYTELRHTGRSLATPPDILRAVFQGRIADVLIASDVDVWGAFDPATETVSLSPNAPRANDEELLNLIAIEASLHGGMVNSLPLAAMPAGQVATAVLRY
ncbi:MAG TPA: hypothetical protein VGG97_00925 [Bryobacteraceae bacterium]|jgi:hypothetical protein